MAVVRYLVRDVESSLPFYEALGFSVTERWGPPFSTADPYYNPNFSRKHPFRLEIPG